MRVERDLPHSSIDIELFFLFCKCYPPRSDLWVSHSIFTHVISYYTSAQALWRNHVSYLCFICYQHSSHHCCFVTKSNQERNVKRTWSRNEWIFFIKLLSSVQRQWSWRWASLNSAPSNHVLKTTQYIICIYTCKRCSIVEDYPVLIAAHIESSYRIKPDVGYRFYWLNATGAPRRLLMI